MTNVMPTTPAISVATKPTIVLTVSLYASSALAAAAASFSARLCFLLFFFFGLDSFFACFFSFGPSFSRSTWRWILRPTSLRQRGDSFSGSVGLASISFWHLFDSFSKILANASGDRFGCPPGAAASTVSSRISSDFLAFAATGSTLSSTSATSASSTRKRRMMDRSTSVHGDGFGTEPLHRVDGLSSKRVSSSCQVSAVRTYG